MPLVQQLSPSKKLSMRLGVLLFRLLLLTLRVRLSENALAFKNSNPRRSLILLWHNRLALALAAFSSHGPALPLTGLVSASADGAILDFVMRAFGIETARGSSSRRAVEATRELFEALEQGRNIVITPDGPRGPCYQVKPGAAQIASEHVEQTYILGLKVSRAWKLRSWDGFLVPKPFATVTVDIAAAGERTPEALKNALDQLNN